MYHGESFYHPLGPAGLTLTTPPAVEPLTLLQAKVHLRVDEDINEDNNLIAALITASREYAEAYLNRVLITQSWTMTMDDFPRPHYVGAMRPREFRIPKPKLRSVGAIQYAASDGTVTTLDPATYVVDTASLQGRISLAYAQCWPYVLRQANSVTVPFVCGYGDAGTDVPKGILQAMLLCIGSWYENRESVIVSMGRALVSEVPFTVDTLLSMHRVVEF